MWQNIKYYVFALAIIIITTLASTTLQLLSAAFPIGHPASTLATNLSGVTLGTIIMVIGFLKDNRLEEERKRTERERKRAETAEAEIRAAEIRAQVAETKAEHEKELAHAERERAQQQQERAEHLLDELNQARERYERAADAIIQHLRDQNGARTPEPESDP